jgi:hypothetical protein
MIERTDRRELELLAERIARLEAGLCAVRQRVRQERLERAEWLAWRPANVGEVELSR